MSLTSPTNWDPNRPGAVAERLHALHVTCVEALNHAIRGLPAERIRAHLCWGGWHASDVTDLPMADIVDVMLKINVGAYSFEAANGRHEDEWKVWQDVKLPAGKKILPGGISHSTTSSSPRSS